MSEPRMMYDIDKLYGLKSEVSMMQRHIHHEIDNYEMDMSPELLETLKELEKAIEVANDKMSKIQA